MTFHSSPFWREDPKGQVSVFTSTMLPWACCKLVFRGFFIKVTCGSSTYDTYITCAEEEMSIVSWSSYLENEGQTHIDLTSGLGFCSLYSNNNLLQLHVARAHISNIWDSKDMGSCGVRGNRKRWYGTNCRSPVVQGLSSSLFFKNVRLKHRVISRGSLDK